MNTSPEGGLVLITNDATHGHKFGINAQVVQDGKYVRLRRVHDPQWIEKQVGSTFQPKGR